jgi:hypothetical protein
MFLKQEARPKARLPKLSMEATEVVVATPMPKKMEVLAPLFVSRIQHLKNDNVVLAALMGEFAQQMALAFGAGAGTMLVAITLCYVDALELQMQKNLEETN